MFPVDNAGFFQKPKPLREDFGGDANHAAFEFSKALRAVLTERPQDIAGPLPHQQAKQGVHGATHGAGW